MTVKTIASATLLGLFIAGAATAADVRPIQDQAIDLGNVAGDAYYTVQPDGFHVTATLATRNSEAAPVRFEAVLAAGQAISVSAPRGVGEQPISVSIRREDQRVIVSRVPETN